MQKKKFNLSGPIAFLIAVLVLLVFIPINLIAAYSDNVFDMTPSKQYTLSPLTEELLDETSDKQIDIYFLSDLFYLQEEPMGLPLYHTLTELESRDNITLTCLDPDADKEAAEALDPTGLLGISVADIFVKSGDTTKKVDFKKCFMYNSDGAFEYEGEELIAGAIRLCTSGTLPTVYFLSGYSDKTLDDNYSVYADEIRTDNYDVKELDLSVSDIPEDTAIIYLAGPQRDISDSDRDKLSKYIDEGGAISMLLPPSETKGRFSNIEYLLEKFELSMNYNILSETSNSLQLQNGDAQQDPFYFQVSYPARGDDNSEDLTTDINITIENGIYIAGISNTRSFDIINSGSEMTEKFAIIENLPTTSSNDEFTTKSEPMGGDDQTAIQARDLTNEPLQMGYYSYNKQTGAKLIVIGTDDIIDNDAVTIPTYGTRMLALFSNTWLSNSDIDMGIGGKANSYDYMTFDSGEKAESVIRLFIIVPIVIALMGVAVWLKRRYA